MMVPPPKPPPGFSAPKKFVDIADSKVTDFMRWQHKEIVAPKKEKKVVWHGARSSLTVPHGVDFMPMDEWDGIIDGFVFKNADKGLGYYRKGITNEGGVKVLKDFFELPDENKGQQTPFRDMSISEARNYKLKTPVKPRKRDNEHKGRRYHQQQKEMNLKKMQDLQETAKKAIKEREQVKPQEINWADFYGKQTPGHPLYEDPKKVVQDISSDEEDELSMFGLLATPGVSEIYSYDNEKLKKMVIVAGVPIEDIVAMDFNKDIKEQLIGLLNR
jgi:hypothetical protein